jgi:hypothetical protein
MFRTLFPIIKIFISAVMSAAITAQIRSENILSPVEVPIEIVRGDMVVQLIIDDKPYRFVLDTGASNSVFLKHSKTKAFSDLEIEGGIELFMPLVNKTVEAERLAPITARVKGTDFKGASFKITNAALIPWAETGLFSRIENIFYDGILGSDLFEAFIVELDQAGKKIRLFDKVNDLTSTSAVNLALTNYSGVWTTEVQIMLENDKSWNRKVLIDTGFPGSLNLYGLKNIDIQALTDVYGPHQGAGRKVNINFGGCIINGVRTVAFREALNDFGDVTGILGIDFLRHFRFAIDYDRNTLHLFDIDQQKCRAGIAIP